jgi:hypothetical protein
MGTDAELERRRRLTFEQAEGLAPLPQQLQRTEVSPQLRAHIWNLVHSELRGCSRKTFREHSILDPWHSILKQIHVQHYHRMADEFSPQ